MVQDRRSKEVVLSDISVAQDVLSEKTWALHKRIGQEYKYSRLAYEDMVKLGEMAEGLMHLQSAAGICNKYLDSTNEAK